MKKIEVVAAILINENKILCVQRAESKLPYISKKFEFPGGKIEAGETQKEALQRELVEELDINVKVGDLYLTVNHQYPDFELTMHSFIVKVESRKLTLNEHIDQKWLSKEELTALDWAVADLPIVHKLISND
ncbi:MAG: (deoxy)nucleoside triphosphate pyrophosphohydrolase [Flavobacteriales bacterium]|nr:(deoxy)nucleoside triphosphate pyrophosphohydrolase [Flavobacteriales bacterium]